MLCHVMSYVHAVHPVSIGRVLYVVVTLVCAHTQCQGSTLAFITLLKHSKYTYLSEI